MTRDPRFLPVYHRTVDVLARFRCSLGCLRDGDRRCCFGGDSVLYLVLCAEPVTSYHWLPWFLVVIHLHHEDATW